MNLPSVTSPAAPAAPAAVHFQAGAQCSVCGGTFSVIIMHGGICPACRLQDWDRVTAEPAHGPGSRVMDSWQSDEDYDLDIDDWKIGEVRAHLEFNGPQEGPGETLMLFTERRPDWPSAGATFAVRKSEVTWERLVTARREKAREFAASGRREWRAA